MVSAMSAAEHLIDGPLEVQKSFCHPGLEGCSVYFWPRATTSLPEHMILLSSMLRH